MTSAAPSAAPSTSDTRAALAYLAVPLGVALSGLCLILSAASTGAGLTFPTLGGAGRDNFDVLTYLFFSVPAAAVTAGLLLWRHWPWLIAAAALLALPAALTRSESTAQLAADIASTLAPSSAPLAIVGVLSAAQEVYRRGEHGLGVLLVGSVVGVQLIGTTVVGTRSGHQLVDVGALQLPLTVAVLTVAVIGSVLRRRAAQIAPGGRMSLRAVAAGGVATLLGLAPGLLTAGAIGGVMHVSADALARRSYVMVGIVGLTILAAAIVLAFAAGTWALVGVAALGLVLVGTADPLNLAFYGSALQDEFGWGGALIGVAAGLPLAWTRWRVHAAAALAVVSAVVTMILIAASDGEPEKLVDQHAHAPAGLMIALFTATAVVTAAATVPPIARRGVLPAALGPLVAAFVLGGSQSLSVLQVSSGAGSAPWYVVGASHLGISATLLLLAAAVIVSIGVGEWSRSKVTRPTVRDHRPAGSMAPAP